KHKGAIVARSETTLPPSKKPIPRPEKSVPPPPPTPIAPPQPQEPIAKTQPALATAPATSPSERRRLPAWPGWAVAGVAAGGIAVGAAFLALDGQPSCEYPSTAPAGIQCPRLYDTRHQGIAYTTLGVAFLAAGITWGVLNTLRTRRK